MSRLLLVALFLETGFVLIVVPWSGFWDRNYFAESLPLLQELLSNNYVRGAVSGLGVVNVAAGIAELFAALVARHARGGADPDDAPASITRSRPAEE